MNNNKNLIKQTNSCLFVLLKTDVLLK